MTNTNNKKLILLIIFLMLTIAISGCNKKDEKQEGIKQEDINKLENTKVYIEMEDGGKMVLELYPEYAPETVKNFVNLANSGFYDGLKFHRIVKGFMIQGGDPKGDGTGGSDKKIKGEFAENGFKQNTLSHTKGVISMARSDTPNSASSQFFIVHGDATSLDGKYAAFGKLIEGEETLDRIADTPVEANPNMRNELSLPKVPVVIKKVTVEH